MKPIDVRLLRYARATRFFLGLLVVLGLAGAGLVIAQATLIAEIVVGAFEDGRSAGQLRTALLLLVAVAVGRGLVGWLTELAAHRASAAVKSELRGRLLDHAGRLGPDRIPGQGTGSLVALATRGVDALDDYFARYLPQLALAVVVPVAVLARIVTEDWVSAAIIAGTLPLIPLFMVLIGWATQSRTDRQWRLLSQLSGHFLDVVAGLPTLKVFGRAKAQAESIRRITDSYRRATLRTLRIAFLSSFALELLATLSVALVAVGIGMRLVHGELDLYVGLVILVLAPEAYLPVRQVGAQFHAAAEGLAAAESLFAVLETPLPAAGHDPVPAGAIEFGEVTVRYPGRSSAAVAGVSFRVEPGEVVALTGPSGSGKSTLLHALLGLVTPDSGQIRVGGADLAGLAPPRWHERIAWVPQHPQLYAGTLAENVRLARPGATDAEVRRALAEAGALDFTDALPEGLATRLGEDGAGLSAGQRQRLALARAFLADRPVLLLDEPTAALDGATEADVVAAVRRLAVGRTVLLVVHRPALLAVADRVVRVGAPGAESMGTGALGAGVAVGSAPVVSASGVSVSEVSDAVTTNRAVAPEAQEASEASGAAASAAAPVSAPAFTNAPTPTAARTRTAAPVSVLARVRALGRPRRGRLGLALLLGALALGSAVGLMGTSGWLISRASEQPPVLYLMVAVTATRAFGIGRAVFRYTERLVSHDAVLRMLADARVAVFRRLESLAPAGPHAVRRGDLLSRLVSDVDALQDYWLRWLLPTGAAVLVSLIAAGFTAWLLPEAGAVLAAGLLLAGAGVPLLAAALARRTERRLAPARGALATRVTDLLTGTAELTVAGALGTRTEAARSADAELTRIASRAAAVTALGNGLTALICGLTVAASALLGTAAVADGRLDGVLLAVVVLLPLAAFESVLGMPLAVQHRQRVRASGRRIHEVLDAPAPVAEPAAPAPAPASPFPLELRGIVARYDRSAATGEPGVSGDPAATGDLGASGDLGTTGDAGVSGDLGASGTPAAPVGPSATDSRAVAAGPPALDGVDLTLHEGRRIAVVGASGAGKTTLAQVLLRFVDFGQGTYRLGGTDARALAGDDVRAHVGLCAQDAHLFDSSVRENLLLARKGASEAELRAALGAARLLGWVDSLPHGLDTAVGAHGRQLSGGQRQRLALARALLAGFPVLVLDEPAEHLDLATADALTRDLLTATEGRTTVLITHRLAGLEAVDEVLVLDRGRVVQRGRYADLVAADGPLRRMREREQEADLLRAADGRGAKVPAGA